MGITESMSCETAGYAYNVERLDGGGGSADVGTDGVGGRAGGAVGGGGGRGSDPIDVDVRLIAIDSLATFHHADRAAFGMESGALVQQQVIAKAVGVMLQRFPVTVIAAKPSITGVCVCA